MIIAVISDIHGNSYALKEVLDSAASLGVEKLLVLGDVVGYYHHPEKVLSMIAEWDHELIKGNHEVILLQLIDEKIDMSTVRRKYGDWHQMAINKLSNQQLRKLLGAPDQKKVEVDGVQFLMCHGSSWDPDYYLYPDSDRAILDQTDEPNVDFILVGHSHHPFVHQNKTNTLINVGSVGQSRMQGGVANWLILDTKDKSFQIMETPYNVDHLLLELEQLEPETDYLKKTLKRNNHDK